MFNSSLVGVKSYEEVGPWQLIMFGVERNVRNRLVGEKVGIASIYNSAVYKVSSMGGKMMMINIIQIKYVKCSKFSYECVR